MPAKESRYLHRSKFQNKRILQVNETKQPLLQRLFYFVRFPGGCWYNLF